VHVQHRVCFAQVRYLTESASNWWLLLQALPIEWAGVTAWAFLQSEGLAEHLHAAVNVADRGERIAGQITCGVGLGPVFDLTLVDDHHDHDAN
jgi:hypothetical protein